MDLIRSNRHTSRHRRGMLRVFLGRFLGRVGFYFSVVVIVSPAAFVFLWMLSLALKTEGENVAYPPVFVPNSPTLENFLAVFQTTPFGRYTANSIIVSGTSTFVALIGL